MPAHFGIPDHTGLVAGALIFGIIILYPALKVFADTIDVQHRLLLFDLRRRLHTGLRRPRLHTGLRGHSRVCCSRLLRSCLFLFGRLLFCGCLALSRTASRKERDAKNKCHRRCRHSSSMLFLAKSLHTDPLSCFHPTYLPRQLLFLLSSPPSVPDIPGLPSGKSCPSLHPRPSCR